MHSTGTAFHCTDSLGFLCNFLHFLGIISTEGNNNNNNNKKKKNKKKKKNNDIGRASDSVAKRR